MWLVIIGYLVTCVYAWYGIRKFLIVNECDADGDVIVILLIPLINVVFATILLLESVDKGALCNKFFNIKK